MFKIHANTHKIISNHLCDHIFESYGIELNREKMIWGSIAPDILPKYKLYRHYYENSIDYIVLRIVKLIVLNRFLDFHGGSYVNLKLFSRDIGIISHYLADFTTLAHADRWEFPKSLIKHVKYEIELKEFAKNYEIEANKIPPNTIDIDLSDNLVTMIKKVKAFISDTIEEYLEDRGYDRDINYALMLNTAVMEYIIESILSYKEAGNTVPAFC